MPHSSKKTNGHQANGLKVNEIAAPYLPMQPPPSPAPPPFEEEMAPPTTSAESSVWLHITLPRSGNLAQDKHCLKMVHSVLTQQSGSDHFSIYIPQGSKKIRVDFPNHTTKDSAHLRQQITQLLGAGALRTE